MIKFNILLAFRNLRKHKLYTLAHILGLAVGIGAFLSIYIYNHHELSFDDFHGKKEHIYRLWDRFNSNQRHSAMMPFKWTQYMAEEFPEVSSATSIQQINVVVKRGQELWNEDEVIATDTSFFKVFDFQVLAGNKDIFFRNPHGVVLEERLAKKYYGSTQGAMNQPLTLGIFGSFLTFTVDGVVRCPQNSHIQFEMMVPFAPVAEHHVNPSAYESFSSHFVYSYVHIPVDFDPELLQARFKDFLVRHADEALSERYTTFFQPLSRVYLDSTQEFDFNPRGSRKNINILWAIGLLIITIASVNFVNLSTAKFLKRGREVGVRKLFGSDKRALVGQFLAESTILVMLACMVAFILVGLLLPFLSELAGIELGWQDLFNLRIGVVLLALVVVVGLLAGSYPALLVSTLGTMQVLRSNDSPRSIGHRTRKALIILQFGITAILLVGTTVVDGQLHFMIEKDLGIESTRVLTINDGGAIANSREKILLLRNELQSVGVERISTSSTHPGIPSWSVGFHPEGHDERVSYSCIFTDHLFTDIYDIPIVEGRNFDLKISTDSLGFLINETARNHFANYDSTWRSNPIGKNIKSNYLQMDGPVIGVMQDFHYESVHADIKPLIVMIYPRLKSSTQLRLQSAPTIQTLNRVESVWSRINPNIPFDYEFVDDVFSQTFQDDRQLSAIFKVFTTISLLLSMMGLFGLTSFLIQERLRSSSIRKVLGASTLQISGNLIREMLMLVSVSLLLALPASYFLMKNWLESFPYRIDVSIWLLLVAAVAIAMVSLFTITYHVLKMAFVNPVAYLSQE